MNTSVYTRNEIQALSATAYNAALSRITSGFPALNSYDAQRLQTAVTSLHCPDNMLVAAIMQDIAFASGVTNTLSGRLKAVDMPGYLPTSSELESIALRDLWAYYRQLIVRMLKQGTLPAPDYPALSVAVAEVGDLHYRVVGPYTEKTPLVITANNIYVACLFCLTYIHRLHDIKHPCLLAEGRKDFKLNKAVTIMSRWLADNICPDYPDAELRTALSLM